MSSKVAFELLISSFISISCMQRLLQKILIHLKRPFHMNKQLHFDFLLDKTSKVSAKDEIDFDVNITVIDSRCMQLPILDRQEFAARLANRTCQPCILVLCKGFLLFNAHKFSSCYCCLGLAISPTTHHPPPTIALEPRAKKLQDPDYGIFLFLSVDF